MYKTILVPLDGSERAEAIIPHVIALARPCGAKVHLIQVIEPDLILDMPDSMTAIRDSPTLEARKQHAKVYLAEKQAELTRQDIETEVEVTYGTPLEKIVAAAVNHKVDLMAIVSHGRTGLVRAMYGSVAMDIIKQAQCPVLVIRAAH